MWIKYEGKKRKEGKHTVFLQLFYILECDSVGERLSVLDCKVTEGRLVGLELWEEKLITCSIRISPAHEIVARIREQRMSTDEHGTNLRERWMKPEKISQLYRDLNFNFYEPKRAKS